MKIIKNIISFLKRVFNKKNNINLIEAPRERDNKINFKNSLKVATTQNNKKQKVETLTCFGDGLGIQTKISY